MPQGPGGFSSFCPIYSWEAEAAVLNAGEQLGPYLIAGKIGAGGMGEVYRAHDTKLKRDVALKVLPEAFARDPERMARFQREAEVLASLNHPNIAAIYGVEDRALVMEFVEGASPKGPLPFDDAWKIATQIASALEYAHDKGIVHRDLKPANIMITPEGVVKLLDFGLAKAFTNQREPSASPENSPTLTMGATEIGVILGTAGYMSPEQARGKQVDKRADTWSFGVVLYELLTGERLFTGEDAAETLAAVIHKQPDLAKVPREARHLLEECLQKDPKQRLRDIGDAKRLLESGAGSRPAAVSQTASRKPVVWMAAAGLLAAVALALGFVSYRHVREEPPRVIKVSVLPPEKATLVGNSIRAVSPDGRHLAFVATTDGKDQLWLRDLDSLVARALAGTEDAYDPFWSPDSRAIAFFADGKLKKIEVAGGPALTLCDVPGLRPRGGSWGGNGDLLFVPNNGNNGIFRVPAAGGTATPVTEVDRASGEGTDRFPWFLPDGRHFLYSVTAGAADKNAIYVADVDSKSDAKNRQRVLAANSMALYAPPGYLLFVRDRTLMAQPFDAGKMKTTGDAVPVAEQIDSSAFANDQYQFSVSQNGVLAYTSGGAGGEFQLTWTDRSGKVVSTASPPGVYNNFRLALDEKRIVFDRVDSRSNQDVWVIDTARGVTSRLTFDPANDNNPLWSPDGLRVLYPNNRSGAYDLYIRAATGAGQEEALIKLGTPNGWGTSWSRDGRFIMYVMPGPKTGLDLWVAPQFGDRKPFPYLQTPFNEQDGAFSPDGLWVAYVSDESSRNEVYVQAFPLSGTKFQISTGGGTEPTWRTDGGELFYRSADGNLMAVQVKSGAIFEAGVPKSLFSFPANTDRMSRRSYAVANDGRRFLIALSARAEKTVPMTVVLNWDRSISSPAH
ncbi:MAG TPA: protein kinase [Bryobacteraceae bacterium]|nr:protein kinase [Bryobacteraceae bacterium]